MFEIVERAYGFIRPFLEKAFIAFMAFLLGGMIPLYVKLFLIWLSK